MQYNVKKFLLNKIDDLTWVLQNKKSMTLIFDKRIAELYGYIEKNMLTVLDDDLVTTFFKNDADSIKKFLLSERLIEETIVPKLCADDVVLISNNSPFSQIFKLGMQDKMKNIKILNCSELNDNIQIIKTASLIIAFWNPFILSEYYKTNDLLRKHNVVVKNIVFYNNSIYMSNYAKKDWHTPCPHCFIANLESQLRGLMDKPQGNFQFLVDLIYEKKPFFKITADLKPNDYLLVLVTLTQELNELENDRALMQVTEIDYSKQNVKHDLAVHWGVCDCYEKELLE